LSAPGFLALARKGLKIKLYGRADGPVKQEEEEEAKAVVAMHMECAKATRKGQSCDAKSCLNLFPPPPPCHATLTGNSIFPGSLEGLIAFLF
jgi:hypothetical protein